MQENVQEFEPSYEWHKEGERDVIEFHVPGFKKEQLRVQVTSYGMVKVSGDRIIDNQKRYRFEKELNLDTESYIWENIRAKLSECGGLHIILPRKVPLPYSTSSDDKEEGIMTSTEEEEMKNADDDDDDEESTSVEEPSSMKNNYNNGRRAQGYCEVCTRIRTLDKKRVMWLFATATVAVALLISVYMRHRQWNVNNMDMDIYP